MSNFEYQQGNGTGSKHFKDGELQYTYELEYYTDKPNAYKLELQDIRGIGIVDNRFGKLNNNLLKRWKVYNNVQNQLSSDEQYSYTTDAVVQMKIMTKNGFITTYSYQYQ